MTGKTKIVAATGYASLTGNLPIEVRARAVLGSPDRWPYGANEVETQLALLEWAEQRKLHYSYRAHCLHWIARGRCGVSRCREGHGSHRWMDHVTGWTRDGKPTLLVCQPYGLSLNDLDDLVATTRKFDLEAHIDGTGWYGCQTTWIELKPKADLPE